MLSDVTSFTRGDVGAQPRASRKNLPLEF